jgi:mitochondrial fusion and transport protein UGO1
MSMLGEDVNPLRPYHIPVPPIPPPIDTSSHPVNPHPDNRSTPANKFGLGTTASEVLSDLDYSEYLSDGSPSVLELIKSLIDQGLYKYTSVLLAQPFEVAKIILQVQDAGSVTDQEDKDRLRYKERGGSSHDVS